MQGSLNQCRDFGKAIEKSNFCHQKTVRDSKQANLCNYVIYLKVQLVLIAKVWIGSTCIKEFS